TGNVEKEHQEEINRQFSEIVDDFFTRRQSYYQKKHQFVQGKLTQLKQILYKAKAASRKPGHEARQELKGLQEDWKKVGKVTGNLAKSLYQEFRNVNNSVFTASGTRPSRRVNVVNNTVDVLKERQQMVADVQKVAGNPDPSYDDVQKIKTMQQNWKRMGQIPREQSKPLTASFYTACSLIN